MERTKQYPFRLEQNKLRKTGGLYITILGIDFKQNS